MLGVLHLGEHPAEEQLESVPLETESWPRNPAVFAHRAWRSLRFSCFRRFLAFERVPLKSRILGMRNGKGSSMNWRELGFAADTLRIEHLSTAVYDFTRRPGADFCAYVRNSKSGPCLAGNGCYDAAFLARWYRL